VNQPHLFTIEPAAPTIPKGRWLEQVAGYFSLLSKSPTLALCIHKAAEKTAHQRGGQEYGAHYEKALVPLLTNPRTLAKIEAEFITAALAAGVKNVLGLTIEELEGDRPPADIWVTFRFTNKTAIGIPVNVKTMKPGTRTSMNGLSLATFIRHCIDPDFDLRTAKGNNRGYSTDDALLTWLAEDKRLVAGRDYYVLNVEANELGIVEGFEFYGLMSSLCNGEPIVQRSTKKETVNIAYGGNLTLLPDDYDIARALVRALLPRKGWDPVRLYATAALSTTHESAAVAARLRRLTDEELRRAILSAIAD